MRVCMYVCVYIHICICYCIVNVFFMNHAPLLLDDVYAHRQTDMQTGRHV